MPEKVYVFLVTKAGLAGLESLGCGTGPALLDGVPGPQSSGSNAEFETFATETGLEIFGTGLEMLGAGTGLVLSGTGLALFGVLAELETTGTGTGLALGAVMGPVLVSSGTGPSILETGLGLEHLRSD